MKSKVNFTGALCTNRFPAHFLTNNNVTAYHGGMGFHWSPWFSFFVFVSIYRRSSSLIRCCCSARCSTNRCEAKKKIRKKSDVQLVASGANNSFHIRTSQPRLMPGEFKHAQDRLECWLSRTWTADMWRPWFLLFTCYSIRHRYKNFNTISRCFFKTSENLFSNLSKEKKRNIQ